MSGKLHVNDDGDVFPCHANIHPCQFGEDKHFPLTIEGEAEARAQGEKIFGSKYEWKVVRRVQKPGTTDPNGYIVQGHHDAESVRDAEEIIREQQAQDNESPWVKEGNEVIYEVQRRPKQWEVVEKVTSPPVVSETGSDTTDTKSSPEAYRDNVNTVYYDLNQRNLAINDAMNKNSVTMQTPQFDEFDAEVAYQARESNGLLGQEKSTIDSIQRVINVTPTNDSRELGDELLKLQTERPSGIRATEDKYQNWQVNTNTLADAMKKIDPDNPDAKQLFESVRPVSLHYK